MFRVVMLSSTRLSGQLSARSVAFEMRNIRHTFSLSDLLSFSLSQVIHGMVVFQNRLLRFFEWLELRKMAKSRTWEVLSSHGGLCKPRGREMRGIGFETGDISILRMKGLACWRRGSCIAVLLARVLTVLIPHCLNKIKNNLIFYHRYRLLHFQTYFKSNWNIKRSNFLKYEVRIY